MPQVNASQSNTPSYLDILQVFRGFAAVMVVIHHSIGSLHFYHKIDNPFLNAIGVIGKFGVDFFFVLSGFIIAYSVSFKYNKPHAFRDYVLARVLRIYVPYLPVGIAILLLYTVLPGFSNADRDISIFTSLTLMPHGNPALSVAWTLLFELMFYFLFSMTFISRQLWNYFLIFWTGLILLHNYTLLLPFTALKNPVLNLFLSAYNIEFIFGFLLAQFVLKKVVLNYGISLFLCFLFGSLFLIDVIEGFSFLFFSKNLFFALFTFFLIYFSVTHLHIRLRETNILMLVGNATYSIYLIHNPLQSFFIRFWPKITSFTSLVVALGLTIIICSVAGYVYYSIFEKWALHKVRSAIETKIKNI